MSGSGRLLLDMVDETLRADDRESDGDRDRIMTTFWDDFLSGTPTPEVVAFSGRVLLILIAVSFIPAITGKWAPRWTHRIVAWAVVFTWIMWGTISVLFHWDVYRPYLAAGWDLEELGIKYMNDLGYFGLSIWGMIFALFAAWEMLTGRQIGDHDPDEQDPPADE